MHQPQSLTAAAAAAAANGRLGASGGNGTGVYGHASSSPSPSRSSFGADSVSGISMTSGFMSRPPLRGTLSDGLPPGATSQYGNAFTPPLYSSGSAAGSTSNLSSSLHPPSLVHSLSNSSLNSAVASSVTSPLIGPNAGSFDVSPFNIQSQQGNSELPPFQGPLSANDPRTSLLVLNLPYKVRWQDLKVSDHLPVQHADLNACLTSLASPLSLCTQDLFRRSSGTVLRADVSLTPDGRSRGFGSVLMRDAEDARKAKECFDGFEWMGRRLEVTIERGGGGGWGTLSNAAAAAGTNTLGHHMLSGAHYNQSSQEGLPIPLTFGASGAQVGSKMPPHMVSGLEQTDYANHSLQAGAALRSPQALALQNAKQQQYGLHPNNNRSHSQPQIHHFAGRSPSMVGLERPQMMQHMDSSNGHGQSGSDYLGVPQSMNATSPSGFSTGPGASTSTAAALTPPQVQQLRSASFSSSTSGRRGSSSNSSVSPPFYGGQATGSALAVPNAGSGPAQSPNLPAPPFPPAAPSPSSSSLPPGAIPTQHQLAVLSAQAAQAAVAAQQAKVVAENGGMPEGSYYGRTLFVGNLSYATQWQDLKDLFRSAGNIVRADIALSPEGRSRGFGTALFGTKDEAARAVRMFHGYDHNGRTLKVHFDRFARMEAPPLGVLVPARVEDYTSAFNAAQPPSNVGGVSGGNKTAGGSGVQPSQSHGHLGPMSQQPMLPDQAMMQMQVQMQHGAHSYLQPGTHSMSQVSSPLNPSLGATPRGSISQSSGIPQHMLDHRTSPMPPRQQPYQPKNQSRPQAQQHQSQSHFDYEHGVMSGHSLDNHTPDERGGSTEPSTGDPSAQLPHEESSGATANGQGQAQPSSSGAHSSSGPSSGPSAHPGRIRLPSPPSIPHHFHPYAPHGATATFSPAQGRAPMPMTPGVPLTPGMPGFTFAGMPPQTPPAFAAPFMSPGLGLMSPGIPGHPSAGPAMIPTTPGAGPPTPWQLHGISAAPGAPLRMAPPPGQATPRGVANTNFNPFFANAIPGAAYPHQAQPGTRQMPPTPGWNQPPRPAQYNARGQSTQHGDQSRGRDSNYSGSQQQQVPPSNQNGTDGSQQVDGPGSYAGIEDGPLSSSALNESAVSSRSASPANPADQLDDGYPFPAVTPGGTVHMNEQDQQSQPQKPSSAGTAGKPNAIAGLPLISRRASTNSPAVSPGIFGLPPGTSNPSFGYFGAAMVSSGLGSSSQVRGSGSSDESGDGQSGFPIHAHRERRPSLDASALRTPMRDESARGGYFGSVEGGGSDAPAGQPQRTDGGSHAPSNAVSPHANASPAEQYHGMYAGGKEGSLDGRSPDSGSACGSAYSGSLPKIAIAAGHQSTEEMARAIAKMSIEGKALRRAGANAGGYNGAAPGSASMSASASASSRPELGGRSNSGSGTPITLGYSPAGSPAEKKSA